LNAEFKKCAFTPRRLSSSLLPPPPPPSPPLSFLYYGKAFFHSLQTTAPFLRSLAPHSTSHSFKTSPATHNTIFSVHKTSLDQLAMVSFTAVTSALLLAVASVQGLAVPYKAPPPGWATDYLESYMTYHTRYIELDCQAQHDTAFFNTCCHPLLKDESLSTLPAECTPSTSTLTSTSTASAASASASDDGGEGDDCDGDGDGNDDGDDEGDDGDCSEDSQPNSSVPVNVGSQPTLTTSSTTAKATTSTHVIPTSTSSKNAASTHSTSSTDRATTTKTSSSATSTSSGSVETGGVATFFYQNGVAGACGTVHSDSDLIAAIDQDRYGNSGEVSALCGQQVKITNTQNGKTVTVTIADDCPTCENANSIDLSVGAFTQIATEEQGEVPITWQYV
jgi:hypothetical protein